MRSGPSTRRASKRRAHAPEKTLDKNLPGSESAARRLPSGAGSRLAIGVFLAALSLRLLHLIRFKSSPFFSLLIGDSAGYDQWARRLAAGDWIGKEVFYQSPLYPYLLGALFELAGRDLLLVRLLQGIAGAAACSLIALAASRMFGPREGLVSGLLLAVYAPAIFYDSLIQKASLDFLLSSLLVFLIVSPAGTFSPRRCLGLGLVLGLLWLNRENALLVVPLVALWVWRREPSPRGPLLWLVLGIAVVIAPVTVRNYAVGGELQPTTSQLGPNLYIGNNPDADGYYEPLLPGRGSPEFEQSDATVLAEKAMGRTLSRGEVSHYWRARATDWIAEHPVRWLKLVARKLLLFWNALEVMDSEDIATHAEHSAVLRFTGIAFHFGLLAPLGLLGIWVSRARWREFWIFPGILAVYTLSVVLVFVLGRYRLPVVPVLALFAGAGVVRLVSLGKEKSWRALLPAAALLAILLLAINLPLGSPAEMRALTRSNFARAFSDAGKKDEAIALYREALALTPGAPRTLSALGTTLAERGSFAEARPYLEQALVAEPALAAAHNSLGTVSSATGQQEQAISEFRAAVASEPANADFVFNLATALSVAGRSEESIAQFLRAAELDPGNAGIRNNLGIALARAGRFREAVEQLELAAQLQPESQDAARNLARARAMLGESQGSPPVRDAEPR